jgi:hypothetical protein
LAIALRLSIADALAVLFATDVGASVYPTPPGDEGPVLPRTSLVKHKRSPK